MFDPSIKVAELSNCVRNMQMINKNYEILASVQIAMRQNILQIFPKINFAI